VPIHAMSIIRHDVIIIMKSNRIVCDINYCDCI
jgi:hypothetical protein